MYSGDFSQPGDDLLEMLQVGDVEHNFHAGLAVGGAGGNVADIAFGVSNHAGNAFQHPETVVAENGELDRIGCGSSFIPRPLYFDAAFGLVKKISDVRAVNGMDSHAFAARDVTNDAFAADGVTTARAVDQHVALALDGDGVVVAAEDTAHYAGNRSAFAIQLLGGIDVSSNSGRDAGRQQTGQHLACRILSIADARHQIIHPSQAVTGSHFLQFVVFDFLERDAV